MFITTGSTYSGTVYASNSIAMSIPGRVSCRTETSGTVYSVEATLSGTTVTITDSSGSSHYFINGSLTVLDYIAIL
jgi:hypothetical protein